MNKKKILTIIIAAVVAVGGTAGIASAVKYTTSAKSVMVVPVSDFALYAGLGSSQTLSGYVTSEAVQNVFLTDSQTVSTVNVREGDSVKAGTVLLTYDTSQTSLNLQKEQLNSQQIQLNIQIAERNLDTLSKIRPTAAASTDSGDDSYDEGQDEEEASSSSEEEPEVTVTPEPTKAPEPETEGNTKAQSDLGEDTDGYSYTESGDIGTEENPERFLCTEGADISADFINKNLLVKAEQAKADGKEHYYFVLEVRKGDTPEGESLISWTLDAMDIAKVADDWTGKVQRQNPPIPTVTPTPVPSAVPTSMKETGKAVFADFSQKGNIKTVLTADASDSSSETKSSTTENKDSTTELIKSDAVYTSDELAAAKTEQQQKLTSLKTDLQESQIKISLAQKAVDEGLVKAKMDGVVKKAGDPKNPPKDGTAFLQVAAQGGQFIRGGLREDMVGEMKEGDTVTVTSLQSGNTYEAEVMEISPYPDDTGTLSSGDSTVSYYPFLAQIKNGGDDLQNQESVQITWDSGKSTSSASDEIYLMSAFIRSDGGQKYVYIRDKNKRLKKQDIKVGKISYGAYQITSGLKADDYVAFPYGKEVKEGAKTREGSLTELTGQ